MPVLYKLSTEVFKVHAAIWALTSNTEYFKFCVCIALLICKQEGSPYHPPSSRSQRGEIPAAATNNGPMAPASAIPAAAGPTTAAETNHASTTEAIGSGIASETLVEATQETLGDSRAFIWLSFAAFFCFIQALSAQRLVELICRCDLLVQYRIQHRSIDTGMLRRQPD